MKRVVIVTGADNGIGLAMSRALLTAGDRVAALDLTAENLAALSGNPDFRPYLCDVTDAPRVQEVVAEVAAVWGRVDVLVNNACLALFKPFVERTPDEICREFEVNYFGYLNMIAAVLPFMRAQKTGFIHNMGSGVGFTGMPGMTGYTSSKGAIEAVTRTLALELVEEGITVNVMHPPLTRTKSAAGFGVPPEMMADPEKVGRGLARRVGTDRPYLTPDFTTALSLWANRHFPVVMGRLLNSMAKRARGQEE